MKFSDILKEGIPIYGEYESNNNKKILDKLKGYYSNTPEYVLNDIFNTNIKQHTNDIIKNYYNDPVLFLASYIYPCLSANLSALPTLSSK